MKIGYIRVSTEEQNTARQEVLLRERQKRGPPGAYPHDELRSARRYRDC